MAQEWVNRYLDGVYFRIKRNGKYEYLCFSDLTEDEREKVMDKRDRRWLKSLCNILANTLRNIGDQLDISCCFESEEE